MRRDRMYEILGHHHISMLTKDAKTNNYFYETIMGMRRVKISVNQDDPTMYHLFYGDLTGSPGTGLTFFEMPYIGQTYRGSNAYTKIGLIVPSEESLTFWKDRLSSFNVQHSNITTYNDRPALHFEDVDGLQLVLIYAGANTLDTWQAWPQSPVPVEHQILGIGPVEITVRRIQKIISTFTELFQYTIINESDNETILQTDKGNIFSELVIKQKEIPSEKPGRGSIHHLAIRAKNEMELSFWKEQVKKRGFFLSEVIDRYYFQSLYFRESNGIIFEIATDDPGFTVDSNVEKLGSTLDLPPFLEHRRDEIETKLTPLTEIKQ